MTSPCDACETSRCCIVFDPELTCADLHRLCRARGLAPEEVATVAPVRADEAGPDAIRFDDTPCTWELRLARTRTARGNGGRRRCQFLVDLGREAAPGEPARQVNRCGVYQDRPMMCRLYPTDRTPFGLMVGSPRRVCPPGAWSALKADVPGLLATHARADTERALHRLFLARWNAGITRAPPGPAAAVRARFFACLLRFHDALEAAPGADPLAAIDACLLPLERADLRA
jgi:Fe-S-cluster containining protein